MPDAAEPVRSDALAANLALTRRKVEIPEEDQVLIDAVSSYYGVRKLAERTLTEFHHPFRNDLEVVNDLRQLSSAMLHYYDGSDQRVACMERFEALFSGMYGFKPEGEALDGLVGAHVQFLDALASSANRSSYREILVRGVDALSSLKKDERIPLLTHAGDIRRLAKHLDWSPEIQEKGAGLYFDLIHKNIAEWKRFLQKPGRKLRKEAGGSGPDISSRIMEELERIESQLAAAGEVEAKLRIKTPDELLLEVLRMMDRGPGRGRAARARIAMLVELLDVPELERRSNEILRQLYFTLRKICAEGESEDVAHAVDLITGCLKSYGSQSKRWLFKGLEQLGIEIARRGEARLVERFIDRLIETGFEEPGIKGVTETWDVEVNPNHLVCLRTWLSIISADPRTYERLLSALTINLHFRGVFVKDTDLFQRDISSLLNADIGSSFSLVLQLVSYLPAFFNAVGSEGELRDASTQIDQLAHRQDPVIHYLRKQCHAESNSRLIGFAKAVYTWWTDGNREVLRPYLPDGVYEQLEDSNPWFEGPHAVVTALAERRGVTAGNLDALSINDLAEALKTITDVEQIHRDRVLLLVRVERLLRAKYDYDADQIVPAVESSLQVSQEIRSQFAGACSSGESLGIVHAGNSVLEELKKIVTNPEKTEAFENIYYKRHIAVGIPSVYGTYHEAKFDALGLMLRLMRFLKPHLERCIEEFPTGFMTRWTLGRALKLMHEMLRALRVAGLRVRDLTAQIGLLEEVVALRSPTAEQYLDILGFISEALGRAVEINFIASHEPNLEPILTEIVKAGGTKKPGKLQAAIGSLSDEFLRSVVASTYAIQELDRFVGRVRDSLSSMTESLRSDACAQLLSYRPDRLILPLHEDEPTRANLLQLGAKGAGLRRLTELGFPIPEGFVVSTRLFRILPALRHPKVMADTRNRLVNALKTLEEETGRRLGDPEQPLLLSVRSGAAFSMPGMMDTILNVGLTAGMVEKMAEDEAFAWTAWDCFRRYLQNVAMSQGVERDIFDAIMLDFKERYGVVRKAEFGAHQMREMAYAYRDAAASRAVSFREDPVEQVVQAVLLVLGSWESETARVYRQRLGLSDDWGTAVIVQRMVFGNLSRTAGSGVVFTRDPWSGGTGVNLYGDFTPCSQGEDVVAGLVHPLPVSERQRISRQREAKASLETLSPDIYTRLKSLAEKLVLELGFEHQEMEFTFESASPRDLYLLQTRPLRLLRQERTAVFANASRLRSFQLARGTGISGGALSGYAVFSSDDLEKVKAKHPGHNVILIRPDTVPEDIPLILQADGLLTARGGATSHAAITAKRLGKVCVVNCLDLEVIEDQGMAKVGGRVLKLGDQLSIDGLLGNVYSGSHRIIKTAVSNARFRGGML